MTENESHSHKIGKKTADQKNQQSVKIQDSVLFFTIITVLPVHP